MSHNEADQLPENPLEHLNFNRADYFIQFFIVSPLPLIFLVSLYQSIEKGARNIEDLATIGLGLYFIFSWILYPLSYLAIQFMAARRINLRKAADKASSRITLKYLSVLGGYFLAIPLSFVGYTVFNNIKTFRALKKGCPSCVSSPAAADAMAAQRAQAEAEELSELNAASDSKDSDTKDNAEGPDSADLKDTPAPAARSDSSSAGANDSGATAACADRSELSDKK
ncbi:hypothetical protein [Anaerobiospirillum sp. NML120449]|uniref:hypothetical protein n=1 Tax=Anaerobiospirillum sp. NML120449 TaxID=2932817 RepID=UPI001FF2159F|nr:hypothetical protein [Anaerobiospirillum sp. NML120449]MCK0526394.1 hypothetical protein [Anaerobiospirillum sp. NML120449]